MGTLSPQAVQSSMQMLEAIQKLEAAGKLPPGSYDSAVSDMRYSSEYSGEAMGQSANDGFTGAIGNPDPIRAPWRGEYDMPGNFERRQHMANSMANDAMLRELMSYSRPRGQNEREGTYALSRYPGIEHAINTAAAGVDVRGGLMTPESVKERQGWAAEQARLLGMDRRIGRDEWQGFRRATKGRGAKQRRQAFKGFLRG
jgi:hypothetical protein